MISWDMSEEGMERACDDDEELLSNIVKYLI